MPQTKSWTGHEKLTKLNPENPIQSPVPQVSQQLKVWGSVNVISIRQIIPAYQWGRTAERGVRQVPYVSAGAKYDGAYICSRFGRTGGVDMVGWEWSTTRQADGVESRR